MWQTEEFISNLNSNENAVMRELYLSTTAVQDAITAQARAIQKIADAARKSYYESVTDKRWGDSHSYELCVDSSIGVEETADLIAAYIKINQKIGQ